MSTGNGSRTAQRAMIFALAALVLAGDVWLLRRTGGSSLDQIAFALRILGLYTIVLGFLKTSRALAGFGGVLDEMTSPNLISFAAGNFLALGILFEGIGIGLKGTRAPGPAARLAALGRLLLVPAALLLLAFTAFHLLVIMPLAYVGYLLAGAIVQAIASAPTDARLSVAGPSPQAISLRAALTEDPAAARSYLVGVPSLVLSFALELVKKVAA